MLGSLKKETQEFVAKYLCDMSKAISTIGLATYFFKDLPWFLRIALTFVALAFLILSVILIEKKGDQK